MLFKTSGRKHLYIVFRQLNYFISVNKLLTRFNEMDYSMKTKQLLYLTKYFNWKKEICMHLELIISLNPMNCLLEIQYHFFHLTKYVGMSNNIFLTVKEILLHMKGKF